MITIFIYSLGSGGAERVVSILLEELSRKYKIKLVLMNETIFYNIPKGIEVVFLEKSNPNENGIFKILKLPFLAYKYSKIKTDISISFLTRPNYINIISNLFKKSRTIISERSFVSEEFKYNTFHSKISKILIRILYKKADLLISLSHGSAKDLKNYDIQKIKVIYNPIDIKQIKILAQENIEIQKTKFTFITIGRFVHNKNHQLLIKALPKETQLWIIGDGEERSKLEKMLRGRDVVFLGRQSNPFKYLSQADCFVFGSNYESFGNVLIEALSCNLPIISTDCLAGPREILSLSANNIDSYLKKGIEKVEYGVLTTVNDVESMTKAMNLMIEDKKLRDAYKDKALTRAKDFDKDKILKEWIKLIDIEENT